MYLCYRDMSMQLALMKQPFFIHELKIHMVEVQYTETSPPSFMTFSILVQILLKNFSDLNSFIIRFYYSSVVWCHQNVWNIYLMVLIVKCDCIMLYVRTACTVSCRTGGLLSFFLSNQGKLFLSLSGR